ncbi:MAG: N-formylglutamate amidohydrolase [Pseudomonadota bacterium]
MDDASNRAQPSTMSDRGLSPTAGSADGQAPFSLHLSNAGHGLIILCDHAENTLPAPYGTLGLPREQLERHIGFDIGAKGLCQKLAAALDATLVMSKFSRLLIDPNRGIDDPTLIMRLSDGAVVPGNARHTPKERAHRIEHYYRPYDDAISRAIDHVHHVTGRPAVLLSIHSFTPHWRGVARPWHAGVLWDKDARLARPLIDSLSASGDIVVGDNEPYTGELPGDTMNRHGTVKGLPHALLEVRQDLIADGGGIDAWARRLTPLVEAIVADRAIRMPLVE